MDQESTAAPALTPGTGRVIVHLDPRMQSDDPVERLSWSLDAAGRELFDRPDIREQLRALLTWPGRVSGWRRASHVWVCDARSGETFIFGVENSHPWEQPGVATLDPASIVGSAAFGCPPAVRSVVLHDRTERIMVAAVSAPVGRGSLMELRPVSGLPSSTLLSERFPFGHGDAASFHVGTERFDNVQPAGVFMVNAALSLETGFLLSDSHGVARAWMRAEHWGEIGGTLGISNDNTRLADSAGGRVVPLDPAYHLSEIRRVVVAALGRASHAG